MKTDKLFVYGIFLDETFRRAYGMTNPLYSVVLDYATFHLGGSIVMAAHIPGNNLGLTGFLCDIDPDKWESLDRLEAAYDRIIVTTEDGQRAYMYVEPVVEE